MVTFDPFPIPLVKILSTQISVGFLGTQDVINDDEHFVGESHDRFWLAMPSSYAVIEGR